MIGMASLRDLGRTPVLMTLRPIAASAIPEGMLDKLCEVSWDGTTPAKLYAQIANGSLEAYIADEALVILGTVDWPRGRELWLHGLVGRGMLSNAEAILSDLKAIAAFKACSMIGGDGIPQGWKKFGPRMGFKPVSTHYVLEL